jgi:aldose 1-epimerase
MNNNRALRAAALPLLFIILAAYVHAQVRTKSGATTIGGEPIVELHRPAGDQGKPHFTSATLLPGRGMSVLYLKAFLPGKGEIDVLFAPPLEQAKDELDNKDDQFGNSIFHYGGSFLVPYANRIRGKVSPDGKSLTVNLGGQTVTVPANWKGKNPGAEPVAMHGLILRSKAEQVQEKDGTDASTASGIIHAGDFNGHWRSETDVKIDVALKDDTAVFTVTAKNVGKQPLPMGIGWHPYFAIPSGNRAQARLRVPAKKRAVVDNYDNVFPTKQVSVGENSGKYDFNAPGGKPLGNMFLDDNFEGLKRSGEGVVSEISDPESHYGIRIVGLSPQIKSIQVYSPPEKQFIALEPQFNLPDPYGSQWKGMDNGMVTLKPGETVTWRVRLELFTPGE